MSKSVGLWTLLTMYLELHLLRLLILHGTKMFASIFVEIVQTVAMQLVVRAGDVLSWMT